ncbi:hypothetical protein EW026_g2293 [Hermanssonia centrifuga]|uniref:Nitrogen permease regulator 3 n=1 Tax=Hermanssonia centrifuga TaxID=98765 RepID=A0A4S4KNU6_9APHY|nr:hypothetical protein EW026_g2293 [Hermanssonia centrifuga]
MSESLLAILLVTSSAKGSSLVYRWPPHPVSTRRLARPRPKHDNTCVHADNPWRAAYISDPARPCGDYERDDEEYIWRRPNIFRDRSLSLSNSPSHPSSRRPSPSKDTKDTFPLDNAKDTPRHDGYHEVFGYSAEFIAGLLSPHRAMCHQKFELVVDDLAFIGHPVCAEQDGAWRFSPEKLKPTRGRGSRKVSSLAPAIKAVYEAIKDKTIACVTLREFSLELQLPPYLDSLLHNDDPSGVDFGDREGEDEFEDDSAAAWGSEMSFAWRLPALTPWKSLLRLDDEGEHGYELYLKLRGPQMNAGDRELAEQLVKFLDLASVTLCLADMASLLDWDLESQVFPTVRWLVHHRRAKVVDVVHPGLKTIFTLPHTLPSSLAELSSEFSTTFSHPAIPPLPQLLSQISTSKGPHFYGSVVRSKDMIHMYHDVIIWLLKKDLLVTLHLRVRVFATAEIKERVKVKRELAIARRGRIRSRSQSVTGGGKTNEEGRAFRDRTGSDSKNIEGATDSSPVDYWFSMSPKSARRVTRKMSPPAAVMRERSMSDAQHPGKLSDKGVEVDEVDEEALFDESMDVSSSSGMDEIRSQWDDALASMIPDPGRATALERQWLAAMSEGKDVYIAKRFEL